MSIEGQGHSLTLVKGHSDFKVECLTFGLYIQVSDSGPLGPLVCLSSTRHRKVVQNPQVTERERGVGRVVVKPNTAGGSVGRLVVIIEKWSRTPTLSKLTRMIISCGNLRLVGSTRHRKSGPDTIISCGDLRLVASTLHRKVVQNPHSIYYSNCLT